MKLKSKEKEEEKALHKMTDALKNLNYGTIFSNGD
jgi:hypothetical protein